MHALTHDRATLIALNLLVLLCIHKHWQHPILIYILSYPFIFQSYHKIFLV